MTQVPRRFWLLAYPDLPKPVGGIKQMHRVGEAIQACGHEVVLVQDSAAFHPGWFHSDLPTTDRQSWSARTDLTPERDVVILAETFLPSLPAFKPGVPKILLNQNGAYSFGIVGKRFVKTAKVLALYRHPDLQQIWCVSEHDRRLLSLGLGLPSPQGRFPPAKVRTLCFLPTK